MSTLDIIDRLRGHSVKRRDATGSDPDTQPGWRAWPAGRRRLLGGLVILAAMAGVLALVLPHGRAESDYDLSAFGAAALWVEPAVDWASIDHVEFVTPAPQAAPTDATDLEVRGCVNRSGSEVVACSEGRSDSDRLVILAGDSKTFQWHPAIAAIAQRSGWRLTSLAYSACPLTLSGVPLNGEAYTGCEEWIPKVTRYILDAHPDLLIVSGGRTTAYAAGGDPTHETVEALVDGYAQAWQIFVDAGIPVVVLRNNPSPPQEMWECAATNADHLADCTYDYPFVNASGPSTVGTQILAARRVPEVDVINLDPWICPHLDRCPAVIGNVMVYRRQSHLTRTFVTTMTPVIARELERATDGLFGSSMS